MITGIHQNSVWKWVGSIPDLNEVYSVSSHHPSNSKCNFSTENLFYYGYTTKVQRMHLTSYLTYIPHTRHDPSWRHNNRLAGTRAWPTSEIAHSVALGSATCSVQVLVVLSCVALAAELEHSKLTEVSSPDCLEWSLGASAKGLDVS